MNQQIKPCSRCNTQMTTGQRILYKKHGTSAEFAKACYECVPSDISMDEARAAIEKYNAEWEVARRII